MKHRALNAARGARRRREREARAMADRFAVSQQSAAFDRADAIAAVEALEQLEPGERELVVMRIWGGLTYDEIAVALGHLDIERSSAIRASTRETSTNIGVAMFDEHEPAEFELAPDLAALERQLPRLTPAAPRIDRDRLMFEAGRRGRGRPDPAKTAGLYSRPILGRIVGSGPPRPPR